MTGFVWGIGALPGWGEQQHTKLPVAQVAPPKKEENQVSPTGRPKGRVEWRVQRKGSKAGPQAKPPFVLRKVLKEGSKGRFKRGTLSKTTIRIKKGVEEGGFKRKVQERDSKQNHHLLLLAPWLGINSDDMRTRTDQQNRFRNDYTYIYHQRKFRSSNFRLYWKLPVALAASMFDRRDVLAGRNCAKCYVFP